MKLLLKFHETSALILKSWSSTSPRDTHTSNVTPLRKMWHVGWHHMAYTAKIFEISPKNRPIGDLALLCVRSFYRWVLFWQFTKYFGNWSRLDSALSCNYETPPPVLEISLVRHPFLWDTLPDIPPEAETSLNDCLRDTRRHGLYNASTLIHNTYLGKYLDRYSGLDYRDLSLSLGLSPISKSSLDFSVVPLGIVLLLVDAIRMLLNLSKRKTSRWPFFSALSQNWSDFDSLHTSEKLFSRRSHWYKVVLMWLRAVIDKIEPKGLTLK